MRTGDEQRRLAEIAREVEREDPRMARILRNPPWWWRVRASHVSLWVLIALLWLAAAIAAGVLSVVGS